MTQTPELLEVIQSDREAAAWRAERAGLATKAAAYRAGQYDNHSHTQDFARHRIEHATPISVHDIARAIADGFSNGNEQFEEASAPQQERYIEAARAVQSATPSPVEGRGEMAERVAKAFLAVHYDWHGDPEPWWQAMHEEDRQRALRAALAALPLPDKE